MLIVEHRALKLGKWYWIIAGLFTLSFGIGAVLTMHVHYTPSQKKPHRKT
jgi:hypothetical protein